MEDLNSRGERRWSIRGGLTDGGEEGGEALKFLIEPPPRFRNDETWGGGRRRRRKILEEEKLNTLDLKRMNTVAIPALDFSRSVAAIFDHNGGQSAVSRCNGGGGGLRIDLCFVGAPILKRGKGRAGEGSVVLLSEGKSVRFKDEQEEAMLEALGGIDGKDARVESKFDPPRFDVAVENGNNGILCD